MPKLALSLPERPKTDDERYEAIAQRDALADDTFVFAVRTTRVYCRPSCRARPANRQNISFFNNGDEARRAGFRPCLRCRPDEPSLTERHAAAVAEACRLIRTADEPPSLKALATATGLGASHLARVFKGLTGVTPKAFSSAHRAERAASALREGRPVTTALYDAGFNAASRFYASAAPRLGMRPKTYRDGGIGETIQFAVAPCSLGSVLVAETDRGVCAILIGDDPAALESDLRRRFPRATVATAALSLHQRVAAVVRLVETPAEVVDLPLDISGTAFQQRVWTALRAIPAGRTASYAEIAAAIGRPSAVRAVAQACASNPLAVAIPCHRVIGANGSLSGYRWGLERKRALLKREAAEDLRLFEDP